jgi:hypothetical protein
MYVKKGLALIYIFTLTAILLQPSGTAHAQDVIVKLADGTEIEVNEFYFFSNNGTGRNSNPHDGFEAKRKGTIEKTYNFSSIRKINVNHDDGSCKTKITFDNGDVEKCTKSDVHYIMG